jgi:V/A-type H+-transporting ATPase subunit A
MRAMSGSNIERGIKVPSLNREKKWEFVPVAKVGDEVEAGDIIGTVQETVIVEQRIMVPYGVSGVIESITGGSSIVFLLNNVQESNNTAHIVSITK